MKLWKILDEEKGTFAIMIGIVSILVLALAAAVIDIGFIVVTKSQLHHIADAAALAGARQLSDIYEQQMAVGGFPAQQNYILTSADRALIVAAVNDVSSNNTAAGKSNIQISSVDIKIGQWRTANAPPPNDLPCTTPANSLPCLQVTNAIPDAVEITARMDGTANGPMATFFAQVIGINTINVTSTSVRSSRSEEPTAALTGVGMVAPGELDIPVGISERWFENQDDFCDQDIRFFPTNDPLGCAGWFTYDLTPANANTLQTEILEPMLAGTYQPPGATAYDTTFEFIGGNVASALPDLKALYDANKNAAGEWETFVAVYQSTDCSNPSGSIPVVGFASTIITNVGVPPDPQVIEATVKCDLVQPNTRGGGASYGTKGSIPGLVQ